MESTLAYALTTAQELPHDRQAELAAVVLQYVDAHRLPVIRFEEEVAIGE